MHVILYPLAPQLSQQPKFKRVLQNLKIHVPFFNRKILEHPG